LRWKQTYLTNEETEMVVQKEKNSRGSRNSNSIGRWYGKKKGMLNHITRKNRRREEKKTKRARQTHGGKVGDWCGKGHWRAGGKKKRGSCNHEAD